MYSWRYHSRRSTTLTVLGTIPEASRSGAIFEAQILFHAKILGIEIV